jgi:Invasin, domain 3
MRLPMKERGPRPVLALVATLALLATGCGLDEVEQPPVNGPSETGISVQLTALPDTLNADGVSEAVVQLVLRRPDGSALSGLAVYFTTDGDGTLVPSASSTYVGPVQSGLVMATDRDGVANVVYVAGTGLGTVTVYVRPYGIDGARWFERTVEILQR